MSYFLAPALVQLRNEVNSRWPIEVKYQMGGLETPRIALADLITIPIGGQKVEVMVWFELSMLLLEVSM